MKREYSMPAAKAITMAAETLLTESDSGVQSDKGIHSDNGIGYGGIDTDGSNEASARRGDVWDSDDADEDVY